MHGTTGPYCLFSTDFLYLFIINLMVVNMYKHIGKVVIKILQGSAVTQTTLGGLTTYLPVAHFL